MATLEDAEIPVAAVDLPGVTAAVTSAAWRSSGWAVFSNIVTTSSTAKTFIGKQ